MASWIASIFGIEEVSIDCGMKYLGFNLKPKGYKREDWSWLLDRFYSKISGWESRFLSIAGRLVLIQEVLPLAGYLLGALILFSSVRH